MTWSRGSIAKIVSRRVEGGVLQLTLGISLIIAMICASMIALAYFNKVIYVHHSVEDDLRNNAGSGIEYAMAMREDLKFHVPIAIDLFDDQIDSVDVVRKPWGVFEIVSATARRGDHRYQKSALITALQNDVGKAIIYSPENNAPIYLAGNTRLEGTAYVSSRKFSTGYMNNATYSGTMLLRGDAKQSTSDMPSIDTVLLSAISGFIKGQRGDYHTNALDKFPFQENLSFGVPESNHYFSSQSLELSDSLSGNLIIESAIKVHITSGARLNDLIVIAPVIDVDKEFKGAIQCIATHSITIGRDSHLSYPSALVLLHDGRDSVAVIGENAVVEGIVILPGFDQSIQGKGRFKIEKGGLLHGMAYINGEADIQGSIWGHITARTFSAASSGGQFPNHIYNAEISSRKKSPAMPGSLIWARTKDLVVAKWLD